MLYKLLQKQDPHPELFDAYQQIILHLAENKLEQKFLRLFEIKLLSEIGYGLSQQNIMRDQFYRFCNEDGFVLCQNNENTNKTQIFSGKNLIALFSEELNDLTVLQDAKRLLRFVIANILGDKIIQSRKLIFGG